MTHMSPVSNMRIHTVVVAFDSRNSITLLQNLQKQNKKKKEKENVTREKCGKLTVTLPVARRH